eukprot:scaffold8697_cov33-Tisochrysis_lutea.AAC.2
MHRYRPIKQSYIRKGRKYARGDIVDNHMRHWKTADALGLRTGSSRARHNSDGGESNRCAL